MANKCKRKGFAGEFLTMTAEEKLNVYKILLQKDSDGIEDCYESLEQPGDLKTDYAEYSITAPINCDLMCKRYEMRVLMKKWLLYPDGLDIIKADVKS